MTRLIQSSAAPAIAVGLLAAGGPPSGGYTLGTAETDWFQQGWGSGLRSTWELRRRLAGLATATSQYEEYLRKVHRQADRQLGACDSWLIRSREEGESQAERIEMNWKGNLMSYLGGNSYLYRSLQGPIVTLSYCYIVLSLHCLIHLNLSKTFYLEKDNNSTPIV